MTRVRYVPGDDLRILLAAREFPAFTIAGHYVPRACAQLD
jgi:hypothetical protein